MFQIEPRQTDENVIDNHMINGTKLLNVAGMTRGRRDGILKSEKMRHVVKIGPMHLKGVW
jgi:enhanced filamentous growth protein 1